MNFAARWFVGAVLCVTAPLFPQSDTAFAAKPAVDSVSATVLPAQLPDSLSGVLAPVPVPNDSVTIKKQTGPRAVAVLTFKNGDGISQSEAALITDRLNVELFKTGQVTLLERDQIADILKEQGFQSSGACNDEACIVQMGQVLGVQEIVTGSIGRLGTLIMINVRTIDVTTGRVQKVVSQDITGQIEAVIQYLPNLTRALVGLEALPIADVKSAVVKPDTAKKAKVPEEMRPVKNAAMLSVFSVPTGAVVALNGRIVGATPWQSNQLAPGRYAIKISQARYDDYSETLDLSAGFSSSINQQLTYRYGVVSVQSSPVGASLALNGRFAGKTPWYSDTLAPGLYTLRLDLEGCRPVVGKLNVLKGVCDTAAYRLFTIAELDSMKHTNRSAKAPKRWARRVVFGSFAVGALVTGIVFNNKAESSSDKMSEARTAYEEPMLSSAEYTKRYNTYRDLRDEAQSSIVVRNILYGVAGGFGLFFTLSIPF